MAWHYETWHYVSLYRSPALRKMDTLQIRFTSVTRYTIPRILWFFLFNIIITEITLTTCITVALCFPILLLFLFFSCAGIRTVIKSIAIKLMHKMAWHYETWSYVYLYRLQRQQMQLMHYERWIHHRLGLSALRNTPYLEFFGFFFFFLGAPKLLPPSSLSFSFEYFISLAANL